MRPRHLLMGVLCLVGMLSGCATHYYRSDAGQTSLYLRLSQAHEVILFTSADGYAPHPARRTGVKWVNTLPNAHLLGREVRYFYRVDGELFIPACRYREKDDFGQENCIFHSGR